jgi:hypothetical protein
VVKKMRREDESGRATDEPWGRSEEVADASSGTEDEKVEERPTPDERISEKKAASPGPSGA